MSRSPEPLIDLPRGTMAFPALLLTLSFGALFLICYGGASWLSGYVPYRVRIDLPFESAVPFVPEASLIYLSVALIVSLAPFILRRLDELFPFFAVLCFETAFAALVFVSMPVETGYPPRSPSGPLADVYRVADWLNMARNELPALHVAFAFTAAAAYRPKCGPRTGAAFWLWAVAIAFSTLLLHEHHVLDLAAGIALAGFAMRVVAPRMRRPELLERVEVELSCLREFVRFSRRHLRYLVIALALYRASFGRFAERRVLRTGFCLLQSIDDLLDGDRPTEREPLEVVDELIGELESRRFSDDALSRLAAAFVRDLEGLGDDAGRAYDVALGLIRHMQTDRRRALAHGMLSEAALREHHRGTFAASIDLMLLAARSRLRAADCPALIEALGWCSTMRDLDEDLDRGLINIPAEVIALARGEGVSDLSYAALRRSPAVRSWMGLELGRAKQQLDLADRRIATFNGSVGAETLALFAKSIRRYTRRYSRSLPRIASASHTAADRNLRREWR